MGSSFRRGAREGLRLFMPLAVGVIPWAIVTGLAMRSTGLSETESMGMSLLVYAATAQLGTLPLIAGGAPLWLIFLTGMVLNLRFVIFSATLSPALHAHSPARRLLASFLLTDTLFAILTPKLLAAPTPDEDADWRWGFYIAPALCGWLLWQSCVLVGVLGAGFAPQGWSLEFMGTIALMVMIAPLLRARPMGFAALVGGLGAVLLHGLPLRLGLFAGILLGIAAGFAAEHWQQKATT